MRSEVLQPVSAALRGLAANPLRAALSTLGVVVGVGALVAVFALADGLEAFSRGQVEQTTDLQLITVVPVTSDAVGGYLVRRSNPLSLTTEDAGSLTGLVDSLAEAALTARTSDWVTLVGDSASIPVTFWHTTAAAVGLLPAPVVEGRFLNSGDEPDSSVVVISHHLAQAIVNRTGQESPLGYQLTLPWGTFRVVGALAADGAETMAQAFIPYGAAAHRLSSASEPLGIVVKVREVEDVETTLATVEQWVKERFGSRSEDLRVTGNLSRAKQAKVALVLFKIIMGSIAAISLIVGGIGIMNVLLASVSERTREIGVRRAVGARRREIALQFLVESVLVSGLGSLIGVIVGMAVAIGITMIAREYAEALIPVRFTYASLTIATGTALAVGLFFGVWPARRAARLSPVEALRQE